MFNLKAVALFNYDDTNTVIQVRVYPLSLILKKYKPVVGGCAR